MTKTAMENLFGYQLTTDQQAQQKVYELEAQYIYAKDGVLKGGIMIELAELSVKFNVKISIL